MLSVIIPTYNERNCLQRTLETVWQHDVDNLVQQILVCDGGSNDGTPELATAEGVEVIACMQKGRSAQMNAGARKAAAPLLYFLHADTLPPRGFSGQICQAVQQGFDAGCYRLSFDHRHWFLQANCWFTRFNISALRFGDQSLFVRKDVFDTVGGFCEAHQVLEDQELVKRLQTLSRFTVLPQAVITSARKYRENGIYKTQGIFFVIYCLYRLGLSQQQLVATYRRLIRQDKL